MKKTAAVIAIITAAAGVFAFASTASATNESQPFVTVAWRMPDTDWPQQYVVSVETTQANVNAVDNLVTDCGRYQIDVYTNGAQAQALISGGMLNSPADDANSYVTHKYLVVTDCTPVTTVTTSPSYVPDVPVTVPASSTPVASSVAVSPAFTG